MHPAHLKASSGLGGDERLMPMSWPGGAVQSSGATKGIESISGVMAAESLLKTPTAPGGSADTCTLDNRGWQGPGSHLAAAGCDRRPAIDKRCAPPEPLVPKQGGFNMMTGDQGTSSALMLTISVKKTNIPIRRGLVLCFTLGRVPWFACLASPRAETLTRHACRLLKLKVVANCETGISCIK